MNLSDGDLGGRIAHTTFGQDANGNPYTVELGANWVQGIENNETGAVNPIWTLAQKVRFLGLRPYSDDWY
jgi:polyamine oxidase